MAKPVKRHPKPHASDTTHHKNHSEDVHSETRIIDAIIETNHLLHLNSSIAVTNLNVTELRQEYCFNCTRMCGPHRSPLADTPWYWYAMIGLMFIIVAMGAGLGTWIFLDESKTRKERKKAEKRRNFLAGSNTR
ncbi:hypothetical protein BDZ45DRAFT_96058 [Acephala macrosclerotiorum]|nr:hypothetical protein BDZ45DRAFT_96058 [Acephala macrosclerotiorum]